MIVGVGGPSCFEGDFDFVDWEGSVLEWSDSECNVECKRVVPPSKESQAQTTHEQGIVV